MNQIINVIASLVLVSCQFAFAANVSEISCDNSQIASPGEIDQQSPGYCLYVNPTVTLPDGAKTALRAYPFANAEINSEGFCKLQGQANLPEYYYVGCDDDDFCDSAAAHLNADGSVQQLFPNRVGSYPNGAILQIYCKAN